MEDWNLEEDILASFGHPVGMVTVDIQFDMNTYIWSVDDEFHFDQFIDLSRSSPTDSFPFSYINSCVKLAMLRFTQRITHYNYTTFLLVSFLFVEDSQPKRKKEKSLNCFEGFKRFRDT